MPCSTRTRSTESYSQKLSAYLASVWSSYNPIQQPLSSWAKSSATTFVSTSSTTTPIKTVISDITTYAESQPRKRRATGLSLSTLESLESQFNRTFSYEYSTWYDAFVEEAKEDPEGPSASDRWTLFVAKKLQRKTTHDLPHLMAAASAWLLLNRA